MEIRAGTSGYSYKEWKGHFYPEKLAPAEMLAYYAERLSAVEINNTFYRMPRREVVESWARQVPEAFRFAVKVSQRITHRKRLAAVEEELDYLLEQLAPLGSRLGLLLVQLPPNLPADLPRLERFLDHLAARVRAAFEFRHASWLAEPVLACLRDRGAALVASETNEAPAALHETARFGYLRLRRTDYRAGDLADWAARVRGLAWDEAYVFFKHEQSGPALAAEFAALAQRGRAIPVRRDERAREVG
ncbi:MAG TPA: DUF72 domain-containing protein [Myxococcota bacterium]|nr:DUF72 domain-containing protein [Myxococcota bacterium]